MDSNKHIIKDNIIAREALQALDNLPDSVRRTLFVVDERNQLVGSLTDGDIRRGLLAGMEISHPITDFIRRDCKFLLEGKENLQEIKRYRKEDIFLLPLVNADHVLLSVVNLQQTRTILPISAILMAGGRGERLRPLTDNTPKPMLKIGGKPIIEINIDRLISFGVKDIFISVRYMKEQIMEYFGDGSSKGVSIKYIEETDPLGTLGCLSLVESFKQDNLLVMNSDLLTNIDFEDFYDYFKTSKADMTLASIPYKVNIPYAVIDTNKEEVKAFKEKPTYTYYSNGGIYLMKAALQRTMKTGAHFNATDMMDMVIADGLMTLKHYPLLDYWLDIGKHQDFLKAQEDIKRIHF